MDMTIAAMSRGERAMLTNVLARGLASLPPRQRIDAAAAADRLVSTLNDTPLLSDVVLRVLTAVAFQPRGRTLAGYNPEVTAHATEQGLIERRRFVPNRDVVTTYVITRAGWDRVWNTEHIGAELLEGDVDQERQRLPRTPRPAVHG